MIAHPYRSIIGVLAAAAGACAIAVPAAAGLSNNPTFSEHIRVPVPTAAQRVSFDDHGTAHEARHDHGGRTRHAEPGDDRSGRTRHAEPGDDRGRDRHHDQHRDNRHDDRGRGRH